MTKKKLILRNTNESTHVTDQKSLFSPVSSGMGDLSHQFVTGTVESNQTKQSQFNITNSYN